jgi:hypothetical protein
MITLAFVSSSEEGGGFFSILLLNSGIAFSIINWLI